MQNLPRSCKNVVVASDFYEIEQILSIYAQPWRLKVFSVLFFFDVYIIFSMHELHMQVKNSHIIKLKSTSLAKQMLQRPLHIFFLYFCLFTLFIVMLFYVNCNSQLLQYNFVLKPLSLPVCLATDWLMGYFMRSTMDISGNVYPKKSSSNFCLMIFIVTLIFGKNGF